MIKISKALQKSIEATPKKTVGTFTPYERLEVVSSILYSTFADEGKLMHWEAAALLYSWGKTGEAPLMEQSGAMWIEFLLSRVTTNCGGGFYMLPTTSRDHYAFSKNYKG